MNGQDAPPNAPPDGGVDNAPEPAPCCCDSGRAAGAKFCQECGTSLRRESEAAPPRVPIGPSSPIPCGCDVVRPVGDTSFVAPRVPDERDDPAESALAPPAPSCACGRGLPDDARFCPGCGCAVGEDTESGLWLVRDGSDSKARTPVSSDPVIIGKDEACDVVLARDAYVSRRHARISQEDDLVYLEDLGSANGTLLRIRRPILIEPGDEVVVGTTVLRLERCDKAATPSRGL